MKIEEEQEENQESRMMSRKVVSNAENIIKEENSLMKENTDLVKDKSLHENFLSSYCANFFKSIFNEDNEFNNIYDGSILSPTKMYGMNVLNKYYSSKKEVLYSVENNSNISTKRFLTEDVIESDMSEIDTALNFNEPTTTIELKLKKLKWNKENPYLKIKNKKIDYSKYKAINIRWAIDSPSASNLSSQKSVIIKLEDKSGKVSSIVLNSENSLRKIEGREKVSEDGTYNWSRYTPLSDIKVPLSAFKDIDLNNIKNMILSFNNSDCGSVYIDEISLT